MSGVADVLACAFPGCDSGGSVERCGRADGRLACAAHRTLRNGRYVCLMCDRDDQAREAARAQETARRAKAAQMAADKTFLDSRHLFLLWGALITTSIAGIGVGGFFTVIPTYPSWARATDVEKVVSISLVLVPTIVGVVSLVATRGFRQRELGRSGLLAKAVYWAVALPGILLACVTIVGLVLLVAAAAGGAKAEMRAATTREAVRDGVRDALRD